MEYKELSKLYHIDSSNKRDAFNKAECKRRRSMDSTFDLEIETPSGNLFIAMPREMSVLVEKVLRAERKCSSMLREVPSLARAALIRGLVLDEVVSTNAIENINSTRKQIADALESGADDDITFRRFKELAILYLGLDGSETSIPKSPEDIRSIYDTIMDGELDNDHLPDGKLFRKDPVEITAGGIKVVHKGVAPEDEIISYLNQMLDLVSREDIPEMIRAIASHYLFEYVHPFYDGNGRTGRYLLALFLNEALSTTTVLSLSRAIAENKNKYYSAFVSVENPLNHGEMTFFVMSMLDLIRIAQSSTIERVQTSIDKFELMCLKCNGFFDQNDMSDQEKKIVFTLAQFNLFGMVRSLSWEDLSASINLSKQMTRKYVRKLEEKGIAEITSKRPLKVALTKQAECALGLID